MSCNSETKLECFDKKENSGLFIIMLNIIENLPPLGTVLTALQVSLNPPDHLPG